MLFDTVSEPPRTTSSVTFKSSPTDKSPVISILPVIAPPSAAVELLSLNKIFVSSNKARSNKALYSCLKSITPTFVGEVYVLPSTASTNVHAAELNLPLPSSLTIAKGISVSVDIPDLQPLASKICE